MEAPYRLDLSSRRIILYVYVPKVQGDQAAIIARHL